MIIIIGLDTELQRYTVYTRTRIIYIYIYIIYGFIFFFIPSKPVTVAQMFRRKKLCCGENSSRILSNNSISNASLTLNNKKNSREDFNNIKLPSLLRNARHSRRSRCCRTQRAKVDRTPCNKRLFSKTSEVRCERCVSIFTLSVTLRKVKIHVIQVSETKKIGSNSCDIWYSYCK